MDRRTSSMPNVRPAGPAPATRTSVSYIVLRIIIVHCTNVNRTTTEQDEHCRCCHLDRGYRGICRGIHAARSAGTWRWNDESLLLRKVESRVDLRHGRPAPGGRACPDASGRLA